MRAPTLLLAAALVACGTPPTSQTDQTRPPVPAGWTVVESGGGDLRLTLPPWLVPFDTTGAIFANVPGDQHEPGFLQLLADGPATAEPQPGFGSSLSDWLSARIASPDVAVGIERAVVLPAGAGVHIDRTLRPESPDPWRVLAWAVATQDGVAVLVIDGPAPSFVGRDEDIARIAQLLEVPAR